jgi:hypothetical protein
MTTRTAYAWGYAIAALIFLPITALAKAGLNARGGRLKLLAPHETQDHSSDQSPRAQHGDTKGDVSGY